MSENPVVYQETGRSWTRDQATAHLARCLALPPAEPAPEVSTIVCDRCRQLRPVKRFPRGYRVCFRCAQ